MRLNVPRLILLDNAFGSSFTPTDSSARDSFLGLMPFAVSSVFRTRLASRCHSANVKVLVKFFCPIFLTKEELTYQMMKVAGKRRSVRAWSFRRIKVSPHVT
jgi:hypothetical protein